MKRYALFAGLALWRVGRAQFWLAGRGWYLVVTPRGLFWESTRGGWYHRHEVRTDQVLVALVALAFMLACARLDYLLGVK